MTLMERIEALIARRRLLDHPFYTAWSNGQLTREALERYAEQYYHWVAAFPTFLSSIHANIPSPPIRQEILENLIDEERGPDNHPELWLRFCDALDLDREAVQRRERLPETREAIATYRHLCREAPAMAALAAIYAYESQQPAVMATKRAGLAERYDVMLGHDYFIQHETIDVNHSAAERRLILANAASNDTTTICETVRLGLDAIYTLLDGVYRRYVQGPTVPRLHNASSGSR